MTQSLVMRSCVVDDCPNPARGKTVIWCEAHYGRMRRRGNLELARRGVAPRDPEERFWERVDRRSIDECWPWTGGVDGHGYGQFSLPPQRMAKAHRFAYELLVGPIPEGLGLDHTCHNEDRGCDGGPTCPHRRCCNPAHLEPADTATNSRRGRAGQPNARKTHCPQGHPYEGDNLYVEASTGRRRCLTCKRAASMRYEQKQRAYRHPEGR